jgi:DNA-binding transcriptional MerR regulator
MAMAKLYKIGDVAKQVGVSVRTLRYLDSREILQPSHRENNGNRLYSDSDVNKLMYINLLRLAGFAQKEIPGLLACEDATTEIMTHAAMLKNKGRYYQKLGEYLEQAANSIDIKNAVAALEQFQARLSEMSNEFHDGGDNQVDSEDDAHAELLVLLRKLIMPAVDNVRIYKQLLEKIPMLINERYFESFMMMIRMYRSHSFRLDELDQFEKNFVRIKKMLESNIM